MLNLQQLVDICKHHHIFECEALRRLASVELTKECKHMKIDWTEVNKALDELLTEHHGNAVIGSINAKIELLRKIEGKTEPKNYGNDGAF